MGSVLYFRPNGSSNIIAVRTGPGNYLVLPVGGVANGPAQYTFTQDNPYPRDTPGYAAWQASPNGQPHTVTLGDGKLNPAGTVIMGKLVAHVHHGGGQPWWVEYAETYPPETTLNVDATVRPDLVVAMSRCLAFGSFPKGMLMTFEQQPPETPIAALPEGVVVT